MTIAMSSDSKSCFDLLMEFLVNSTKMNKCPLRVLENDITMMNFKGYSNLQDIYTELFVVSTDKILPKFAPRNLSLPKYYTSHNENLDYQVVKKELE